MSTNLISTIAQVFNSDLVARIASSLGLDKALIDRALGAGTPALLAALGSLVSRPGGAAAVNSEVARQEPQLFQNLGPLIGGTGMNTRIDAGSSTLKSLLGSQTASQLINAVSRFSGVGEVGATNLMGLLGPIVMSVLSDQQRSTGRSAADIITAQKDNIARALPAGVADALGNTGMLDWFTSSAKATESSYQAAQPGFEFQPAKGRSARPDRIASGSSWIIPALAVLAVGLAWYLLSGPSTKEVANTVPAPPKAEARITTGALPEPRPVQFPSLQTLDGVKVGDVDVGAQVTAAMNGMRNALAGIRDEASAQSAIDPLKRSVTDFEKVKGLADQLSPEMKTTLANAIAAARPTIDGLLDRALQIPGVAALIKPTIDSIRSELDTLATV
jgi:hypothetical protein